MTIYPLWIYWTREISAQRLSRARSFIFRPACSWELGPVLSRETGSAFMHISKGDFTSTIAKLWQDVRLARRHCKSCFVFCGSFFLLVRCLHSARHHVCSLVRKICWILMVCGCFPCLDGRWRLRNCGSSLVRLAAPWRHATQFPFPSDHEMISQQCIGVNQWWRVSRPRIDKAATINTHFIVFTFGVLADSDEPVVVETRVFLSRLRAHFVSSVTAHLMFVSFVHNHAGSCYVFIHHSHLSCPCVHEW